MRTFPFRNSGKAEIVLEARVRPDRVPHALANFVEEAGFAVSELDERSISFEIDRTPRIGFRAPGSVWNMYSGGQVRVQRRGISIQLEYQLYFVFYTVLFLAISVVLATLIGLLSEGAGIWKALGLLALAIPAHCVAVEGATRKFGELASQYLRENQIRYV